MTVFNSNNTGYKDGYPLFLGPDLGIVDTINIQYPKLESLYQQQLSQIWNENEVDLTQDKMDMLRVPTETTDLMVKTIMWQTAADSIAARSIIETLGKFITNSELMNLATIWSFFEVIHARTYSHIIKQTFTNTQQLIEQLYDDDDVMKRLGIIKEAFDVMDNITSTCTDLEIRCAILRTITALLALEAIAFMASFAVTFAITETGVFQGIGQLVKLICRDEVLHTKFDFAIIDIIKKDPAWKMALSVASEDISAILNKVVDQEVQWSHDLFTDGRKVVGLNQRLLEEYVHYMSAPIFRIFGVEYPHKVPKTNPLPYMDGYIDSTSVQAAAQEIQVTNYNIGVIADDNLDDLDLT